MNCWSPFVLKYSMLSSCASLCVFRIQKTLPSSVVELIDSILLSSVHLPLTHNSRQRLSFHSSLSWHRTALHSMISPGFPCLFPEYPSLDCFCTPCCRLFSYSDLFRCSPHFFLSIGLRGGSYFFRCLLNASLHCILVFVFVLGLFSCHNCLFVLIFASSFSGLHPTHFFFLLFMKFMFERHPQVTKHLSDKCPMHPTS